MKVNLYKEQFAKEMDFPEISTSKVLIILSTGRSGSHMLGHTLYHTEKFGYPLEYINPMNLYEWRKRLGVSKVIDIIDNIKKIRTSKNGVFSIKIHYSQLEQIGGFDNLKEIFPNAYYVLITRKNVLQQSISLLAASQTGEWIAGQEKNEKAPEYNFKKINKNIKSILTDNSSWRFHLLSRGCNYIEVDFDSFCKNPRCIVQGIASFMGITLDDKEIPIQPVTKKQSATYKDRWEEKFLIDFSNSLKNKWLNLLRLRLEKLYSKISHY